MLMKQTLAFVPLLIALALQGCGDKEQAGSAAKGYTPTAQNLAILDRLLKDEADTFIQGNESMLFANSHAVANAAEVAKKYRENQVAADQIYNDKKLLVLGTVEGINSGLGNSPYVTLRSSNMFQSPQIHFDNIDVSKVAALKKGQKVSFSCTGNGAIVGTPMFKDCIFANDYAAKVSDETKKQVLAFFSGKPVKSQEVKKLALVSMVLAKELPPSSTCFSDGKNCAKEMSSVFSKREKLTDAMEAATKELESLGLKPASTTKQEG